MQTLDQILFGVARTSSVEMLVVNDDRECVLTSGATPIPCKTYPVAFIAKVTDS